MIGIICAMKIEAEKLSQSLENIIISKYANIEFKKGKIYNKDVVICVSSEGKVNSAMATQLMICKFNPSVILNIGVAGSTHDNLNILDIAIGKNVVQHDYDITSLGYEKGYVLGINQIYIPCDLKESKLLETIAKEKSVVMYGTITSGDLFVNDNNIVNKLKEKFNSIAVDMESSSIGHVAYLNNVKFICLKSISDSGNNMEFREFTEKATIKMNEIVLEYIKRRN